uniref:Thymidylate synthase n=1 Tax=Vombatus ursinus TaxID=29139 RepID=A0A4X2LUS3_VOMUR
MPATGSELQSQLALDPPSGLHGEKQYLEWIKHILQHGCKEDRTGTSTVSVFSLQAHYKLRDEFPLLTTKRVFWNGVLMELLWFIKGSTNIIPDKEWIKYKKSLTQSKVILMTEGSLCVLGILKIFL